MVRLLDKVTDYESQIVRETIEDVPEIRGGTVIYGGRRLPMTLGSKLLKRAGAGYCDDETARVHVARHMEDKSFVLHGLDKGGHVEWYALTSDKFRPIMPSKVLETLESVTGIEPTVREYTSDFSVDFNFPVECELPGLYSTISMGKYGLLGGNGESALRYGVSWFNGICTNWTLFLPEDMDLAERVIHVNRQDFSRDELAGIFKGLLDFKDLVVEKIEDSKDIVISKETLEDYLSLYASKRGLNKGMVESIVRKTPDRAVLYDVAFDMTLFCQKMTRSDLSRKRIEYLAGELLLSYDRIKEAVREEKIRLAE